MIFFKKKQQSKTALEKQRASLLNNPVHPTNTFKNPSSIPGNRHYSRYYTYVKPLAGLPIVKSYGSSILNLAAVAIFIIFAIKPTIETILVLQKKITDSEEVLAKLDQKAESLSQAKKNYENLDADTRKKINQAIPVSVDVKGLITSLESSANQNQATISAIQIQSIIIQPKAEGVTGSTLSELPFTFNAEGSYTSIVRLLRSLYANDRLITINNLILNKNEQSQNIFVSVSGKAYYLK